MTKKYRKKIPRILALIDPSLGSVSAVQQGIQRYAKLYGPWELDYFIGSGSELREYLKQIRRPSTYMGIIARLPKKEDAEAVFSIKPQAIFIDPPTSIREKSSSASHPSCVILDIGKVAALVVGFFIEKQIGDYAFVPSDPQMDWSIDHERSFFDELGKKGIVPYLYVPPFSGATRKHLASWLQKLPKPVAVFTPNDLRGREILAACRDMKIAVPYEVLVLGVGNDEIFCESCFPSLSSVMVHWQRSGFAAAAILDQARTKSSKSRQPVMYEAFEVVPRDSCRDVAQSHIAPGRRLTNNDVIAALEFIKINTGFGIQVEDVARHVGVTRQWLEKRFRSELGHSILDNIRLHRMERIKSLLLETNLPINQIAKMSGYENANHLRIIFKQEFGMSMTDYRQRPDNR